MWCRLVPKGATPLVMYVLGPMNQSLASNVVRGIAELSQGLGVLGFKSLGFKALGLGFNGGVLCTFVAQYGAYQGIIYGTGGRFGEITGLLGLESSAFSRPVSRFVGF